MNFKSKLSLTKVVANLAHPYLDLPQEMGNIRFNKDEEQQIFNLAKSNKVLLRFVNYNNSNKHLIKSRIISDLVNHNRMFKNSFDYARNLQRELLTVIKKFNERSIDTIFIKSLNTLPLDSDNFDVLVREKDLAASSKMLKNEGFIEIPWVKEPYKRLFRYVNEGKDYLAIHLHTAVAWEGIKFIDLDDFWNTYRKIQIDGVEVGVPSPESHLLTTVAHAFFENHKFSLNDLTYIIEDTHSKDLDWNYISNWAVNNSWFNSFHGMLLLADHLYKILFNDILIPESAHLKLSRFSKQSNIQLSAKLINQFDEKESLPIGVPINTVASHYVWKIVKSSHTPFLNKIGKVFSISRDFFRRRIPIWRKPPTFLVCFIGQDGTGKTMHAKRLLKELEQREVRVKYNWSRGTGLFLEPLLKFLRLALPNNNQIKESNDEYLSRREILLKKEPIKSLWAYILIADHLAKSIKTKLALLKRNVVICDRYILDTIVDIKCNLDKNFDKSFERLVERLAPKSHIIFMMDTEPKELLKRRPNTKLDLIRKRRSEYLEYPDKNNLITINTGDDPQKNMEKILTHTLQKLYNFKN